MMRHTIQITATYQIKKYAMNDEIQITKNDIILGTDDMGDTWILIKQTSRREF